MLCIDILRSVPWTVVRPSGCFLLFLSCIVFLFSSAAALVANKDYYYQSINEKNIASVAEVDRCHVNINKLFGGLVIYL